MRIELYEYARYTDTGRYYISRLYSISEQGTISRTIVREDIRTKAEALTLLKEYNKLGLRPVNDFWKAA